MRRDDIIRDLLSMRDAAYKDFQAALVPTVPKDKIIGVRTPSMKAYAKQIYREEPVLVREFLESLPHEYYEENNLHGLFIDKLKDFNVTVLEVERFLPFVDNWATCDGMNPKVFAKHKDEMLPYIKKWIKSDREYTVRYAIKLLMSHYLDGETFKTEFAEMVADVRREEYYVKMMVAWYFATALAKQYDLILPYIEGQKLERWTHNKAIQKAIESYRVTDEQKAYLRTQKIK